MKKIYFTFAIAFSIALFLLSPGMKAEAADWISTPFFHDEHYQNYVSYKINSGSVDKVFSFTLPSREYVYVGFISSKSTSIQYCDSFNSLSGMGSSATLDYMINNVNFSGYYCYVSGRYPYDKLSPVNMTVDASDEYEAMGIICQKLAGGEDPFYVAPTYTPDITGIGYLTGMEDFYKELEIRNQTGGLTTGNVTDKTFHFGWNRTTSTGLDIYNNDYADSCVEVAISSVISRPLKDGTFFYSSTNGKLRTLSHVYDSYSYDYKYSDVLALFSDGLEEAWNAQGFFDDLLTSNYSTPDMKLYFYFRVVVQDSSGNYAYGPWLRMNPDKSFDKYNAVSAPGSSIVVGITDENDNFIVSDSEYGDGDHLTGGYGSGWNWEDAEIDSNKNKIVVNSYAQNAEDLVNMVNSIPNLIQIVFSFFPPWVLGLFSLLVASIVPLVIIKIVT